MLLLFYTVPFFFFFGIIIVIIMEALSLSIGAHLLSVPFLHIYLFSAKFSTTPHYHFGSLMRSIWLPFCNQFGLIFEVFSAITYLGLNSLQLYFNMSLCDFFSLVHLSTVLLVLSSPSLPLYLSIYLSTWSLNFQLSPLFIGGASGSYVHRISHFLNNHCSIYSSVGATPELSL